MSPISLIIVCCLTLIIHFISIISLSARIVGTRTQRVASSASIFNIISLVAQFSNTIQGPLLAKSIEKSITTGQAPDHFIFRVIILSATVGCTLGGFAIPSIHRFMKRGVDSLYLHRSVFRVFMSALHIKTLTYFYESITIPSLKNLTNLKRYPDTPFGLIALNAFVYSFTTVSVLACLYAGFLNPNLRSTALSMTGVSIGLGSIGMMLFIEPYSATLTDKVIDGSITEGHFRRYITFIVIARTIGTLLAQFLIIPMAKFIIWLAEVLYA
ncbi:MAG: DUF2837 family protein [Flectobacillus sp.]|nr:DUF2837 family protein [Flectobacillus sp.]